MSADRETPPVRDWVVYLLYFLVLAGCVGLLALPAKGAEKSYPPLLGSSIFMSGKAGFRFEYDVRVLPGNVVERRVRLANPRPGQRMEYRTAGHCGVVGDGTFGGEVVRDRFPGVRLVERGVKVTLYVKGRSVGSGEISVYVPEGTPHARRR